MDMNRPYRSLTQYGISLTMANWPRYEWIADQPVVDSNTKKVAGLMKEEVGHRCKN